MNNESIIRERELLEEWELRHREVPWWSSALGILGALLVLAVLLATIIWPAPPGGGWDRGQEDGLGGGVIGGGPCQYDLDPPPVPPKNTIREL